MRGEHDELKIFLEIRLIPSRIDQKMKNKEGVHEFFKEGNWARNRGRWKQSWVRNHGVVGAISSAWLCGFKSAGKGLQFLLRKEA